MHATWCLPCSADHLGWFGEKGTVETFVGKGGAALRKLADGTLELTAEEVVGVSTG
jgi:hypothetical protein